MNRDEQQTEELIRHEEELRVGTQERTIGGVRVAKHVETERVVRTEPRAVEDAALERSPVAEHDSGEVETLPDGSISIPVFEEELVVTKRLVVRERVIVRKRVAIEEQRVEGELRRERVEVEGDAEYDVNSRPGETTLSKEKQ